MPPSQPDVRITDEQIATYKAQGFVLLESFFHPEEARAALQGVWRYADPYPTWVANGRRSDKELQHLFPWDDDGLNAMVTHPALIDAAERITGCRDLLLGEAYLGNKYEDGHDFEPNFHIDWSGNTLGPQQDPDEFLHPTFFVYLDDVTEGMAPILMVPNGRPDDEAVPIIAPAGSVAIYSIHTRHSASPFLAPGHRPALWIDMTPKHRLWDVARLFTVKSGARPAELTRFFASATPRQIELLGFPPATDPLWTDAFLDGMADRYPGFDPLPYRRAQGRA